MRYVSKFILETLTPLHIGNGNSLSPYGDYIYDKEKKVVYLIDQRELTKVISEYGETLMDEFVRNVWRTSGQQHYTLKKLFADYHIDYQTVSKAQIPVKGELKAEAIMETIKSGTRPYVPGSSIKGAIRTALLYTHRKEEGYTIEQALSDLQQKKRQKAYIGDDLFGAFSKDILKYLHVSDTELLSDYDTEIVKTLRYHLKKHTLDIPAVKEVIPSGKRLTFRLQVKAKRNYHKNITNPFSYLLETDEKSGEKEILRRVNTFTSDLLSRELNILKKYGEETVAPVIELYTGIINETMRLQEEQNGAILRLGSGKSYFDNTISQLFSDEEIRKMPLRRKNKKEQLFPVTRAMIPNTVLHDSVLGWVKISMV